MGKEFDCVCGNMYVLMYDNTVKKIKDLKKGEFIYSVQYDGDFYRYIKGGVTGISRRKGKAVKITLKDGRHLICSPNHQWLTNSGWMFSYDDGNLDAGKIFLKEDVKMAGLSSILKENYTETKHYMEGYILGTETHGKNLVSLKAGEMAEFVFQESDVTLRMYNYLLFFGADVTLEDCFAHDNNTNEHYVAKKLNIPYKQLISLSERFAKDREKEEFVRGFVAGVYDSDGSVNPIVKNVKSSKKQYLDILKRGLDTYGFEYEYNSREMTATLFGGPSEVLRFYNIFDPVTTRRLENVVIQPGNNKKIVVGTIEEVKCDELVELTTSTRNFLANGIVSHNCTTGLVKEV